MEFDFFDAMGPVRAPLDWCSKATPSTTIGLHEQIEDICKPTKKKHSQLQLLLMEKRCADLQTAFWNPWSETETASWPTLTKTETASWSETETASWTPWSETETAFWTTLSESETASCHSMAGHG